MQRSVCREKDDDQVIHLKSTKKPSANSDGFFYALIRITAIIAPGLLSCIHQRSIPNHEQKNPDFSPICHSTDHMANLYDYNRAMGAF
jgi:hypothetical protein